MRGIAWRTSTGGKDLILTRLELTSDALLAKESMCLSFMRNEWEVSYQLRAFPFALGVRFSYTLFADGR